MAISKSIESLQGVWTGESTLFLSWLPEPENVHKSESALSISLGERAEYAKIGYDWVYKDERQTGSLLMAGSEDGSTSTLAWTDSWHQNGAVMLLNQLGELSCQGSYSAGEGPDWGWRIEFGAAADQLEFKMFNVDPEGNVEPAVTATYSRDN